MMDTPAGEEALADKALYSSIIQHRRHYTKLSGIDYDLLGPATIDFMVPEDLRAAYTEDYQKMREQMIYGKTPEPPVLFERIAALLERFRAAAPDRV
jgi:hypothetical protein